MVLNPAVGSRSAELFEKIRATLGANYTLDAELPPGGMSRVFVATDTELQRSIVVKVLPPELAGAISVERFRREISLEAQLQHPHIVPVHQAGNADGLLYYTMPKIDGESLRARLDRVGELPVREVVDILRDVCRALAYAHGKAIVHRDIKPENVILAGDSAVVLDFGVAKALSASGADATTRTGSLTGTGVSVGTPAYMAPEQAAADRTADHRVDIYALGVLGYEMLCGSAPFTGRTVQEILSAQLAETPRDVATRRPTVPAPLADLVMRCLAKRPADRPQSAAEVLAELDAMGPSGGSLTAVRRVTSRRTREVIAWSVAAIMVLVAVTAMLLPARNIPSGAAAFSNLLPPLGAELDPDGGYNLSPDGSTLAFVADGPASQSAIWLRRLDERPVQGLPREGMPGFRDGARMVPGSENGRQPFWSADGQRIGFSRNGWIWLTSVSGGNPRMLTQGPFGNTPTWGADDVIIFSAFVNAGQARLQRIAADGSDGPRPVLRDSIANLAFGARFFPDGRHFIYVATNLARPDGKNGEALWLGNLDGDAPTFLRAGSYAEPVANDQFVFLHDEGIAAQRIDLAARQLEGNAMPIMRGFTFAASPMRLVTWGGLQIGERAWLDRRGVRLGGMLSREGWSAQIAGDGRRLIVSGNRSWVHDIARGVSTPIPGTNTGFATSVVWTPGDTAVVFGAPRVVSMNATTLARADTLAVLPDSLFVRGVGDVAPDGTLIIWYYDKASKFTRKGIAAVGRDGRLRDIVSGPEVVQGVVSPDGRWLAYASAETGALEVFVRPMPRGEPAVRVSRAGGRWPRWSRDELFFLAPGDAFMATTVRGGAMPEVEIPRELFRRRVFERDVPPYDVSADGQRFIVMASPTDLYSRTFTLLDNWPSLMKRRSGAAPE